jgi:hypothetical protein
MDSLRLKQFQESMIRFNRIGHAPKHHGGETLRAFAPALKLRAGSVESFAAALQPNLWGFIQCVW